MIGKRIGHYEILEPIGKGGMGEVFRARDHQLERDVAVKALSPEFGRDPERIARFGREARTLATLQHPNIASIHGFEEQGDERFLVMELVEGEDLAQRLARGPIPVEDAIELAVQLAEGLEAAHDRGIVHRDLKPANIKVDPDGRLKILDFGLARAWSGDPADGGSITESPTITAAMTAAGTILGTAAYMSPEQARGKSVDQRADLWAFGVILFEMLTGRMLFAGETISDTLAAILRGEPEWDELPAGTPRNVHRLLRRCLARHPRERLRSAGDARLELLDDEPPVAAAPGGGRPLAAWLGAGLLVALAIVAAAWLLRPGAPTGSATREPTHLSLSLPAGMQVASRDMMPLGAPQPCVAISDDGRLVVVVVEHEGATWLYRRFLDEPDGTLLEETRGAYLPRISPGKRWISFLSGNTLHRLAARGERPTRVLELPNSFGHDWLDDETVVINRSEGHQLVQVSMEDGRVQVLGGEGEFGGEEYFWPHHVEGTRLLLVNDESHVAKSEETRLDPVGLYDLDARTMTGVATGGAQPTLLPGGRLITVRDGSLVATPFDPGRPADSATSTTVLEGLQVEGWIGQYAVSSTGTLVYAPGRWLVGMEFTWDGGEGPVEPLGFPLLGYGAFELSPDGNQLVVLVGGAGNSRLWIYDIARGTRRVVDGRVETRGGIWGPTGRELAYTRVDGDRGTLLRAQVGSSDEPEVLLEDAGMPIPYDWHPDAGIALNLRSDIHLLDPDRPGETRPLVEGPASEWGPAISPDGRWIAYTSDESGRYEIYVRPIAGGRSWSVSTEGGEEPLWSADGRSIVYRYGNRFFRVPVLEAAAEDGRFRLGQPEVVVEGAYANVPGYSYDIGPDGRLLLLRSDGGTERSDHLNVILDWDVEVARRMAGGG